MRSLVSPAPMTMTRQPRRSPKIFSASSTATEPTETLPRVMAVRERTDFAAANDDWKSRLSHLPVWPCVRAMS